MPSMHSNMQEQVSGAWLQESAHEACFEIAGGYITTWPRKLVSFLLPPGRSKFAFLFNALPGSSFKKWLPSLYWLRVVVLWQTLPSNFTP